MKEGWEVKRLGEVCEITMGQSPSSESYNDIGRGMPFFQGCSDFGKLYPHVTTYCDMPKKMADINDVLISVRAPIGTLNIANLHCCIGRGLASVREIKGLSCYKYLYFFLLKSKEELQEKGIGATFKAIGKDALLNFPILVPSIEEQSQIVEELDLLSNIIEKKRQQLSELDNLAQSIFYDMFGDPVTNEKGWEVKTVGQLFELKAGKAIKANELVNEYEDGLYACYGGNGIRGYIPKFSHSGCYPIIGRQGALCGNVNLAKGDFYATEHAVVVSCNGNADAVWTYYCMVLMNLNRYAKGVAQPGISVNVINAVNIILPSLELQQLFAQKIKAIEKQKALIKQSIAETEELFNSRMDYYFS